MKTFAPATVPTERSEMIAYLKGHFRYHTMGSWNGQHSYANKIKLNQMELTAEELDKCYKMLEIEEAFWGFRQILDNFRSNEHSRFQIHTNGRSGGYLVLMNGGIDSDERTFVNGAGIDMQEDFESWDDEDLQNHVALVYDFDRTCDEACANFLWFAMNNEVEEQVIQVPRTIKVAVPIEGE